MPCAVLFTAEDLVEYREWIANLDQESPLPRIEQVRLRIAAIPEPADRAAAALAFTEDVLRLMGP